MILTGDVAILGLMHTLTPADDNGYIAYHDGKRYWFKTAGQAKFVFSTLGWGNPTLTPVIEEDKPC